MPACYTEFLDLASQSDRADVAVQVEPGPLPSRSGLRPLFSTDGSWSLWRDVDTDLLVSPPLPGGDPWWAARISRDAAQVTLHVTTHPWPGALQYPLDQLLLMGFLARRSGLLVHSAGLVLDGRAYVFPGRSRAGKTTLTRALLGAPDLGWQGLSDDRLVLRYEDRAGWRAYGTPWPGEAGIAVNDGAPLAAVCCLRQAAALRVDRLDPASAAARLLPVTSIPWYDPGPLEGCLATVHRLVTEVPLVDLSIPLGLDAAALTGQLRELG
jgi:hypothetical protein